MTTPATTKPTRKVTAVTSTYVPTTQTIIHTALCSDSTIWVAEGGMWKQLVPVPGCGPSDGM